MALATALWHLDAGGGSRPLHQEQTFTAFLDGMDLGTALSYSPIPERNPWSVALPPYLPPTWSVIAA